MDPEELGRKEKGLGEEQGKENGRPLGDGSSGIASTVHSEHKQQERRKKAAMFLSRLKKGTKEEENPTQPVYGKRYMAFSVRDFRMCHLMRCLVLCMKG